MTGGGGAAFDPLGLIRILNDQGVRYVVIGGIAAGVQGAIWATADLDIVYARDPDNHERLERALADLNAVPIDLPADVKVILDARSLRAGHTWTLSTRLGRLDLLAESAGLDYATLASRSRPFAGSERYLVASIEDLITMKVAAGRPKDAGQVELLRRVAEESRRDA